MLAETLNDLDTEMANITTLTNAWKARRRRRQSSGSCWRISKNDPQMYQRLLVERNRNWLPQIEALLTRPAGVRRRRRRAPRRTGRSARHAQGQGLSHVNRCSLDKGSDPFLEPELEA